MSIIFLIYYIFKNNIFSKIITFYLFLINLQVMNTILYFFILYIFVYSFKKLLNPYFYLFL